ncbi:hypothetical protein ONS95_000176 [Cadophora gregata]|uniref:uncharacterized protein n=1 Tax=Cadophora gregata TaxID=51156 RepID=UPI0026DCD6E8|nr:uncharacterized protein ONS95_000176 [Cadophora gregata]KAK0115547.1 hypothetical protein ONS96_014000 [Cadophora gregata f. sp. sojae]KAK0128197.1 hypothetical protein ONS95_000176 [Cadophora gregata]
MSATNTPEGQNERLDTTETLANETPSGFAIYPCNYCAMVLNRITTQTQVPSPGTSNPDCPLCSGALPRNIIVKTSDSPSQLTIPTNELIKLFEHLVEFDRWDMDLVLALLDDPCMSKDEEKFTLMVKWATLEAERPKSSSALQICSLTDLSTATCWASTFKHLFSATWSCMRSWCVTKCFSRKRKPFHYGTFTSHSAAFVIAVCNALSLT